MASIQWLQLSDLHFGKNDLAPVFSGDRQCFFRDLDLFKKPVSDGFSCLSQGIFRINAIVVSRASRSSVPHSRTNWDTNQPSLQHLETTICSGMKTWPMFYKNMSPRFSGKNPTCLFHSILKPIAHGGTSMWRG